MMRLLFYLFIFLFISCTPKEVKAPLKAELFGKNTISSTLPEFMLTMNMDNTKAYFNRTDIDRVNIYLMYSNHDGKKWTKPIRVTSFEGDGRIVDPFLTFDERFLFFSSNRLKDPTDFKDVYNIWFVEIKDSQYGETKFAEGLNDENENDIYTTMTKDNLIAFSSTRRGEKRRDIYLSSFDGESFSEPERVFIPGTGKQRLGNPGISPDGNTIVFSARLRDSGGVADLYLTQKTESGWTKVKNLGPIVNSEHTEFTPVFSKDGKYLYFTSERPGVVQDISQFLRAPGDFYRVEWAKLLEELQNDKIK